MPYDPRKNFTRIANVVVTNHVVLVKTAHSAKTIAEFIPYANSRPGAQIATLNNRRDLIVSTVPANLDVDVYLGLQASDVRFRFVIDTRTLAG